MEVTAESLISKVEKASLGSSAVEGVKQQEISGLYFPTCEMGQGDRVERIAGLRVRKMGLSSSLAANTVCVCVCGLRGCVWGGEHAVSGPQHK